MRVLASQTGSAPASSSGRGGCHPGATRSTWSHATARHARTGPPPCRVTNEGKEMRDVKTLVERGIDDDDYIVLDPDLPVPRPELGPLERRVSATFEESLLTDDVDPEAMAYWFTEPKGGWPTEKRRLRKLTELPNEAFDTFAHAPEAAAAQGRAALASVREGQELKGTVTAVLLNHGAQVDIGAEFDGLLPLSGVEQWEPVRGRLTLGAELAVRVHRVRDAALFRFPVQLEALDPALAADLPPPGEHDPPMDLRVMPADLEALAARAGRDFEPRPFQLAVAGDERVAKGEDLLASGRVMGEGLTEEQLERLDRIALDL